LADQIVEHHLGADGYPHPSRSDVDGAVAVARDEVASAIHIWAEQPKDFTVGDVLGEGHRALVVTLTRPGARVPHHGGIRGVPITRA
jgi:hypothetical protein